MTPAYFTELFVNQDWIFSFSFNPLWETSHEDASTDWRRGNVAGGVATAGIRGSCSGKLLSPFRTAPDRCLMYVLCFHLVLSRIMAFDAQGANVGILPNAENFYFIYYSRTEDINTGWFYVLAVQYRLKPYLSLNCHKTPFWLF